MSKSKKKKKNKKKNFDKMSFEKREKLRKQAREERVYTRAFRTEQSFGAAGSVTRIPVEEYLKLQENTDG